MTEEELALAIDSGCDTVAAVELIRQRDAEVRRLALLEASAVVRRYMMISRKRAIEELDKLIEASEAKP